MEAFESKGAAWDTVTCRHTDSEAQRARLVELLKIGPQTTYSLRKHGIAQCATRVFEWRKAEYQITTFPVTAVDSDGYSHVRVALYTLTLPATKLASVCTESMGIPTSPSLEG